MTNIKLEITVDEANLILEALGEQPFAKVFSLVSKIQAQAQVQAQVSGEPLPEHGEDLSDGT